MRTVKELRGRGFSARKERVERLRQKKKAHKAISYVGLVDVAGSLGIVIWW